MRERGHESEVSEINTDVYFRGFGDPQESFNGNDFFSAFHFADVFRIQVRQFSESFLREFGPLAVMADSLAKHLAVLEGRFASFAMPRHSA